MTDRTFRLSVWLLLLTGCASRPEKTAVRTEAPLFRPVREETDFPGQPPRWEPTGREVSVATIHVGSPVIKMTYGDGAVWAMGRKFIRIEPGSYSYSVCCPHASSSGVAVGLGSMWAVNLGLGSHDLRRLDPNTGEEIAKFAEPGMRGFPALGEGSVWVHAKNKVLRVDPVSNQVAATIPTHGSYGQIGFGEGAVWVLEKQGPFPASDGHLVKINPEDNHVAGNLNLGPGGFMLAVGEGWVWLTHQTAGTWGGDSPPRLLQIDPHSLRIIRAIPLYSFPTDIAVAAGSVWVATGTHILRVDPKLHQITEGIQMGSASTALAVGDGALWCGGLSGIVHRIALSDLISETGSAKSE